MRIQEHRTNKDSFSRNEVLGMLASLMNLWNPDDLVWQIAQYMKQMGIEIDPDPSHTDQNLWVLHSKGIRYPDGGPIFEPEEKGLTHEEIRDFIEQWKREQEMQRLKKS